MYSKAKIFNLALGQLLLSRQIIDPETDKSNEVKVLNTHWDTALSMTLQDLDLDSTSTQAKLELMESDPTDLWLYAYKYPSTCAFFRRIQSGVLTDNRLSHVPKRVAIHKGKKVIFTNQTEAVADFIPTEVPLDSLSAPAGLAIAVRLAMLSAPLVTGKGSKSLMDSLQAKYVITKAEAQQQDERENFVFNDDSTDSEFVAARTE